MTGRTSTRGFHALAHDFRITTESEPVAQYFEHVLSGLPTSVAPTTEYLVRSVRTETGPTFEVARMPDDVVVATDRSVGALAGAFVHHLNALAIDPAYGVMCHAGGVERGGIGVVLPADPESGKTTLTAGLVRAGFAYLSDEAVVFPNGNELIEPFPKPLSIDAGSQHLFPELEPAPAPGDERVPAEQWQVPPDAIRVGAVGRPCRARLIVFPKYEADVETALEPVARAAALVELASNTFQFRDHPRRSLEVLAEVVRGAQCFRLAVGDLERACELIADLVDRVEVAEHA